MDLSRFGISVPFRHSFRHFVGLELDEEIAQWAQQKTGLEIRGQRLETLQDDDFDAIFANDVLEHVYNPKAFVASAIRALKVGGQTFFQTVVFNTWQECPAEALRPLYHTVLYSRRSLALMSPADARLVSCVPSVFGWSIVGFARARKSRSWRQVLRAAFKR